MPTILIVDDDKNLCAALARVLESWGYKAVFETDVYKAMALVGKTKLDLILLDIIMPQLFGLDFLADAKQLKPDVAVIMLTGVQDEAIIRKAKDLGAADYIQKPFEFPDLKARIQAVLAPRSPAS